MMVIWAVVAAAAPPNAGEVWLDAAAEIRVSDPISVSAGQIYRFSTGSQGTSEVLTDLGVDARLSDTFRVAAGYRLGSKADDDARIFSHRGTLDAKARADVDWLRLEWRERYQVRLPGGGKGQRHTVRSKLRAAFDLDHALQPRVSAEAFLGLGDGDGDGDGIGLTKLRFDAGFRYELERFDVDLTYRVEEPISDRTDSRLHVVNLGFTWKIDARPDDDDDNNFKY